MQSDTNRSLPVKDAASTRNLSPIVTVKTSLNTHPNSEIDNAAAHRDRADSMESFYEKMGTMKLAPPAAPALRSHVDLPTEDEEYDIHTERSGSTDEVLSPLDFERRFSLPFGKPLPERSDTPMIVTELHRDSNTLVEEPDSYTEPSLLLEGISTADIKPSAMRLFAREPKALVGDRKDSDYDSDSMDVDTAPGS